VEIIKNDGVDKKQKRFPLWRGESLVGGEGFTGEWGERFQTREWGRPMSAARGRVDTGWGGEGS